MTDNMRLEYVSEFIYLGHVLDKSGIDVAECRRKMESESKVAGGIRSLLNAWGLQLEYAIVLYEALLVPVLLYGMRQ